jgi:YD repeat-containing protein
VKTVTGFSGETKAFTYDQFGRTLTETDVIDGISFVNTYTYDQYSNVLSVKYRSPNVFLFQKKKKVMLGAGLLDLADY